MIRLKLQEGSSGIKEAISKRENPLHHTLGAMRLKFSFSGTAHDPQTDTNDESY